MHSFKLYLSGDSKKNLDLTESVKKALKMFFDDRFELRTFNLIENPHLAVQDNVLVTPTLIKFKPEPIKKFVGNFTNSSRMKDIFDKCHDIGNPKMP